MSDVTQPSEKSKRTRGRPRAVIDWPTVERMATALCPSTEIAAALGIHDDTLQDAVRREHKCTFTDYKARFRAQTLHNIREAQLKRAFGFSYIEKRESTLGRDENGNILSTTTLTLKTVIPDTSMLIWLGKQYLGQLDKPEPDVAEGSNYIVIGDRPEGIEESDLAL